MIRIYDGLSYTLFKRNYFIRISRLKFANFKNTLRVNSRLRFSKEYI